MNAPIYQKINSIFKRDDKGKFIVDDYAQPEFEYLFNNEWVGTEKIDGTNIRIIYDPAENNITYRGKTDKAQIPTALDERLNELVFERCFDFRDIFDPDKASNVVLYGEGYGAKIQSGGKYTGDNSTDFILFDIWIDGWWMPRSFVEEVANKLDFNIVPIVFEGTLQDGINFVRGKGYKSVVAAEEMTAEGIVATPKVPLLGRNGKRVITKLKTADFKE